MQLKFLVISLSIAILAVSGCSKIGTSTGNGVKIKGGKVVFALTGDVSALDPAYAYDFTTNPVLNEITEGLLRFSPAGDLLPNLAEKWEMQSLTTYIYHIRQGVKFHDGSLMSADDVVFSLKRIMDKKTASPLAWMLGSVKEISRIDSNTVKIELSKPDAQFRYAMATTAGHVISKAYFDKVKDKFGKPGGGVIGTGPFKLVLSAWKPGSEIILEANKDYWDSANGPFIDQVVFKVIADDNTRVTGLKTEEINATATLPQGLIPVVQAMKNVAVQGVEGYSDDWIAFNTKRAPLDDPKVRQAMIYAFHVQDVMDSVVKDTGIPAKNQPVGPSLWTIGRQSWEDYQKTALDYSFDLVKAKALIAQTKAAKGFKVKLLTDGNSFRINAAQILQANLKEIGIELEIVKLSDQELTARQFSGKRDYDMIMGGWGADYPDPAANIQPFFQSANTGEGGANFAVYQNKKIDALLDEQAGLTNDSKRVALLIEVLKVASLDAPYIFIDHPKVYFAASQKLKGYTMSPVWYWDSVLRNCYWTK